MKMNTQCSKFPSAVCIHRKKQNSRNTIYFQNKHLINWYFSFRLVFHWMRLVLKIWDFWSAQSISIGLITKYSPTTVTWTMAVSEPFSLVRVTVYFPASERSAFLFLNKIWSGDDSNAILSPSGMLTPSSNWKWNFEILITSWKTIDHFYWKRPIKHNWWWAWISLPFGYRKKNNK